MKQFILIVAFSLSSLYAQTSVTLQRTASYQNGIFSILNSNPEPASWKNGIGFAAQIDIPISKSLFLSPLIEFDHYQFERYIYDEVVWIFEHRPLSGRGEDSRIYRFGLEAKLVSSAHPLVTPYVVSGITYVNEHLGDFYLTYSDVYASVAPKFKVQNISKSYWAHSLGVGVKSILFENFGFDFAARYYANYSDRFHISLGLGLIYQFD